MEKKVQTRLKMVLSEVGVSLFLLITLGDVTGKEAAFPANTLAVVGINVTLRCGYQEMSCSQIRWEKRPEFGQLETISDGDTVYDATKYRLNASSFCDLIIEDVQLTDSGTFICTVNGSNSGSANLIVLQTWPSCSSSCVSNSTSENDTVDFTCKLTYRGGGRPEMSWWKKKNHSEVPDVPPQQLDGGTVSRDFSQKAESPQVDPHVCVTRFYFDPMSGRASNAPEVKCEIEPCSILYSVRNIATWPALFANPGDSIACTAEGNPHPSFQWQWKAKDGDDEWADVPGETSEEVVAFLKNGTSIQFRCVAKNSVKKLGYSKASGNVSVETGGNVDATNGPSTGAIAGGGTGGVVAIIFLVICLLCCCSSNGNRVHTQTITVTTRY